MIVLLSAASEAGARRTKAKRPVRTGMSDLLRGMRHPAAITDGIVPTVVGWKPVTARKSKTTGSAGRVQVNTAFAAAP